MGGRNWLEWENDIIREFFPSGGSAECLRHLEHRSITSIQKQAQKLGVKQGTKFFHVSKGGYIVLEPKRGQKQYLHRLIMEDKLGRKLEEDELVHHIDGNKMNNHPDNLALTDRSTHARQHRNSRTNKFVEKPQW